MQTNRGFIQLWGPILIIIALVGGGYLYYQQNYNKPAPVPITEGEVGSGSSNEGSFGTNPQPVACTAEAKICPDGSAVGRTGPKCEFAACPVQKVINSAISVEVKNLIERLYPGGGLPKKAAYLVAELYEDMITSPQTIRDPNRISQLMNCADLDKFYPALLSVVVGYGPDKTERAKRYFEANKNIKAGSVPGLTQEQSCAVIFGDVNNIIPEEYYIIMGR